MKKGLLIFIASVLVTFMCGCEKQSEISGFSLDAPYSLKLNIKDKEKEAQCREYLDLCDKLFNAYNDESYIFGLNKEKRLLKNEENKELFSIIKECYPYCSSYFDISIRNVTELWNFGSQNPIVPRKEEISRKLEKTGYRNIEFNDNEIILKNDVSIELGGAAKGYCADKIFSILKDNEAIIDIGGTIATTRKNDISVGIKNPDGGILCTFDIGYGSFVSTSGIYERNFTYNDKMYHHILNPATGYSVENELTSVTVVSDKGIEADILSTEYFVMGRENENIRHGVSVVYVTKDRKIYIHGNLKLKNVNENYTIVN